MSDFPSLVEAGHRAFGAPQSWSPSQRGVGGELLVADLITAQVNRSPGGSCLFLGLDLGAPGETYPIVQEDVRRPLTGHGGDIDAAVFIREHREPSARYGTSRRGLVQDHLVLIDSKQYSGDWDRERQFERAGATIKWFRYMMSHPQLLGGGSDPASLRLSYHFAHTGPWVPESWLRRVGDPGVSQMEPGFDWWNSSDDLVLESPVEVLLGQLSILLTFANPTYRWVVPETLWRMLPANGRHPYVNGNDTSRVKVP